MYYITFTGYRVKNGVFSKKLDLSKRSTSWSGKNGSKDFKPGSIVNHKGAYYVVKSVKYEKI